MTDKKSNFAATDTTTVPTTDITILTNETNNNKNHQHPHSALKIKIPDSDHHKATPDHDSKPVKKKRRDKSDLGDNFVAPDGGWGWLVAIAGGVNILVTFAVAQQFGIIFRTHMENLGISNSELTTIINTQIAVSAFTGLLNGPLFRRFSYRQVALVGSVLTFIGLFLSVFAESFIFYMCAFSCCYGFGRGLTVSASSLAVNTFFKQKRRTATAYQFGVAGMGPIFLPYFATFLLQFFGVQGTVLIFSAVSLHTIACSMIYQPVKWHVKKVDKDAEDGNGKPPYEEVDEIETIAEPDTPVLPRSNDGWYGSRQSLNTPTYRNRINSGDKQREAGVQMTELKRLNSRESHNGKPRSFSVSHSIKEEDDYDHDHDHDNEHQHDHHKREYINGDGEQTELAALQHKTPAELEAIEDAERKKLPFHKKVAIFFDLDLLRDITYVNLAVGLTLINFVEINFAILTPFILSDFGFANSQIALAMSLLGFCDLVIRFLIPLITAKMNFSNKTFFVVGIIGMCIGRFLLSFTRDFYLMIAIFIWMGLNKAFRTVFWSLIIPGHVPLKRLPAAAGLQLLMSGLFSMAFGPLIGLIRDSTNYAFTLNFLNALCVLAVIMWIVQDFVSKHRNKSAKATNEDIK